MYHPVVDMKEETRYERNHFLPASFIFTLRRRNFTLDFLSISIPQTIMTHGVLPTDPSTSGSHIEVDIARDRSPTRATPAAIANVDSATQEEKERVIEGLEGAMDLFRKGECSRFQVSGLIFNELEKWTGATEQEKGKALDSYLTEINSFITVQDESISLARKNPPPLETTVEPGVPSKRIRDEVEHILDQVSRGEAEDNDDEQRIVKRRAREEEMPWYSDGADSTRRNSCVETCRTLFRFSEDLSGVKALLRVAHNLPEGIPTSQWDRLLRGESVDLNQILSAMHFVNLNEERKGRLGSTEVVFATTESKRHIRTGAEWSAAFRRLSKAVVFLFPHRRDELLEYAEHIEGLFAAKHTTAHSKVILYDQSVRNQVGGGQNILLTDFNRFHSLSEAILHADGIEYKSHGKGSSKGEGTSKGESSKKDICRRFNGQVGCRFTEDECYYKHICKGCGKGGHGKFSCTEKH